MKFSLRAKSMLALGGCIALVLVLAAFAAARALRAIEANLGSAYARNATQYSKQRILTPVERELALAERMADSQVTRQWLDDERDPVKKALFFTEAERYRRAFADRSYFVVSGNTRHYYFSDGHDALYKRPRYTLKTTTAEDAWFFSTMAHGHDTNLNVDPNHHLNVTKVWFNIKVKDGKRDLGLVGTGLSLTTFLKRFISDHEPGVTPMILNREGAIQAHPDPNLIDYGSINDASQSRSTLYMLLEAPGDRTAARNALRAAEISPDSSHLFWATLNDRRQLFAVSFIPELNWHVVTAVDLKAARLMDGKLWTAPLFAGAALLLFLGGILVLVLNRIVLAPLEALTRSARSMADGDYSVSLRSAGGDEIGDLTRAFAAMASRVRSHTEELETTVRRRTSDLSAANESMAAANKVVADSIQYASLIQNAILPDEEIERALPGDHFILWRPRDVVGGDYYVFRSLPHGCLIGIVDCAGHGVPGALMTMAAHTALNTALETLGVSDPAAVLTEMDRRVRATLPATAAGSPLTATMDAGIAWLDYDAGSITFAGARTSLYWSDGVSATEMAGSQDAIAGRRVGLFRNRVITMPETGAFYLTTDGFLDQAGGPNGYSFGNRRFAALLQNAAALPFSGQKAAFEEELEAWQGRYAQRDDVTVLGFRPAHDLLRTNDGSHRPLSATRDL
jgi:serine phosphatase RsbU (regulator of sigma subunit)